MGEELVIVILSMDKEANRKRVSDRHGGLQMWVDTMMVSKKISYYLKFMSNSGHWRVA